MKKKRYFGRGVMFLLCLVFAVLFLLPTVLTITNSFMSESEIKANYGMIFSTTTGGYVSKTVNLKFIPDKVTLSQYITYLRLSRAKHLLETTSLSITETALQSGFPNVSYFIRTFKNTFHVPPLQYRNSIR